MSNQILVPSLGESITEATVSKWLKQVGEKVDSDEPLVELETDKVNVEVPSPLAGTLSSIKVKEGDTVEVGTLLGIVNEGKSASAKTSKIEPVDQNQQSYQPPLKTTKKKNISKTKDPALFEKSKKISEQISDFIKEQSNIKIQLNNILSSLPNIALNDVPVGKNESSNKEISKNGAIPKFDFKPKSHYELGEKLNMLDFDLATKTTGSRFVFVKDKLAEMERAISNFM